MRRLRAGTVAPCEIPASFWNSKSVDTPLSTSASTKISRSALWRLSAISHTCSKYTDQCVSSLTTASFRSKLIPTLLICESMNSQRVNPTASILHLMSPLTDGRGLLPLRGLHEEVRLACGRAAGVRRNLRSLRTVPHHNSGDAPNCRVGERLLDCCRTLERRPHAGDGRLLGRGNSDYTLLDKEGNRGGISQVAWSKAL